MLVRRLDPWRGRGRCARSDDRRRRRIRRHQISRSQGAMAAGRQCRPARRRRRRAALRREQAAEGHSVARPGAAADAGIPEDLRGQPRRHAQGRPGRRPHLFLRLAGNAAHHDRLRADGGRRHSGGHLHPDGARPRPLPPHLHRRTRLSRQHGRGAAVPRIFDRPMARRGRRREVRHAGGGDPRNEGSPRLRRDRHPVARGQARPSSTSASTSTRPTRTSSTTTSPPSTTRSPGPGSSRRPTGASCPTSRSGSTTASAARETCMSASAARSTCSRATAC